MKPCQQLHCFLLVCCITKNKIPTSFPVRLSLLDYNNESDQEVTHTGENGLSITFNEPYFHDLYGSLPRGGGEKKT